MRVYITTKGSERLRERISEIEDDLERIRREKAFSYGHTGDKWHDNPTFHRLEQEEQVAVRNINEMRSRIADSTIVSTEKRNTNQVEIGSVVEFECTNEETGEKDVGVFEIVGFNEGVPEKSSISYNSPLGNGLMKLKPGDKYLHKTKSGIFVYLITKLHD